MKFFTFSFLVALALFSVPGIGKAATPGSLIKGSGSSVYYLDTDQKRYVFPTEGTYKSWYSDFSQVQTVSDQELMAYGLGRSNVTYRPGVRLLKVTTDPRVYAVGRGGTLRWIETEAVARALYGENWTRQIDDLPDAFFSSYRIGPSIRATSDFSVTLEREAVSSIGMNRPETLPTSPALPTPSSPSSTPVIPPASTSTVITTPAATSTTSGSTSAPYRILLELSPASPAPGAPITLRAEAQPPTANFLALSFEGVPQRTCEYYICSMSLDLPFSLNNSSFTAVAEARWGDGGRTSSTLIIRPQGGSSYIEISLSRPDVEPGGSREIIARAVNDFVARSLDIYIDGGAVRSCLNQQECRYTSLENSPIGTIHSVYVVAANRNGQNFRSDTKMLSVVTNDSPTLDILLGKTRLFPGEMTDVQVTAADDDGVRETTIIIDGQIIKTCQISVCSATIGPWPQARSIEVVARARDLLGAQAFSTSTAILVQP